MALGRGNARANSASRVPVAPGCSAVIGEPWEMYRLGRVGMADRLVGDRPKMVARTEFASTAKRTQRCLAETPAPCRAWVGLQPDISARQVGLKPDLLRAWRLAVVRTRLARAGLGAAGLEIAGFAEAARLAGGMHAVFAGRVVLAVPRMDLRSEERRVGKEWRARASGDP